MAIRSWVKNLNLNVFKDIEKFGFYLTEAHKKWECEKWEYKKDSLTWSQVDENR